jgi:hypothetical protein
MRTLAVAAILCAAVTGFPSAQFKYRDFFSGVTVGILLVLVIALFRAHSAEVDGDDSTGGNEIQRPGTQKKSLAQTRDNRD